MTVPRQNGDMRTEAEKAQDAQLQAARASFPGLDIHPIFGGYLAVPKGTVVTMAASLDGLMGKLYARE